MASILRRRVRRIEHPVAGVPAIEARRSRLRVRPGDVLMTQSRRSRLRVRPAVARLPRYSPHRPVPFRPVEVPLNLLPLERFPLQLQPRRSLRLRQGLCDNQEVKSPGPSPPLRLVLSREPRRLPRRHWLIRLEPANRPMVKACPRCRSLSPHPMRPDVPRRWQQLRPVRRPLPRRRRPELMARGVRQWLIAC